jgi:hypothetical protein
MVIFVALVFPVMTIQYNGHSALHTMVDDGSQLSESLHFYSLLCTSCQGTRAELHLTFVPGQVTSPGTRGKGLYNTGRFEGMVTDLEVTHRFGSGQSGHHKTIGQPLT